MEELRYNFNKLVQKTLAMEDPRLTSQSLVAYSDNKEDINQTRETEKLEKNQDFSPQAENKIVNRHRVRYTAIRQQELNQETFCLTFLTLESIKVTFTMKVLS